MSSHDRQFHHIAALDSSALSWLSLLSFDCVHPSRRVAVSLQPDHLHLHRLFRQLPQVEPLQGTSIGSCQEGMAYDANHCPVVCILLKPKHLRNTVPKDTLPT
jgi:hypothetical protein